MAVLSIVIALLIEQVRPLPVAQVRDWLDRWARFLERQFNAGEWRHGAAAWVVGAALPALIVLAAYWLLVWSSWLGGLLLGVAVLYLTAGFRQFSHHFTELHLALRLGDLERARSLLKDWLGVDTDLLASGQIARLAIEQALIASHRHVFAPLFWFAALGPAGAVLYRLAWYLSEAWRHPRTGAGGQFGDFAAAAFVAIDWLPVRLTAASFAVVGDFEDAIYCWRTQADRWPDEGSGILLATGAGALGVRLGMPIRVDDEPGARPEMGMGEDADPDFMQSAIGLVWRTLVMAVLLLALLGIANWAG